MCSSTAQAQELKWSTVPSSTFQAGDTILIRRGAQDYHTITDTDFLLTDEQIEDIAGPLVATGGTKTGIVITYQDSTGDMDFDVDHDTTTNFVVNEHINHSVTLTAGIGLSGGGDISANRTFNVNGVLEDLDILGANAANSEFLVGTGAGALAWESGATARTSLGVDAAGTDNSTDVTLAGVPDYLQLSGQEITMTVLDVSDDTNLAAGTNITLSGDTLNVDDAFLINSGDDTTTGILTTAGLIVADNDCVGLDCSAKGRIEFDDTTIDEVNILDANVGIGTSTPEGKLNIVTGSAGVVTPNAVADEIVIESSTDVGITFLSPDASPARIVFGSPSDNVGAFFNWTFDNDLFQFGVDTAGGEFAMFTGGTERLRLASDGSLGILTTTPLKKLDVNGSTRIKGSATSVLTGTIDPAASTAVVGVGTAFTTELVVGDRITVTGETRSVTAIADTTHLTVDTAFTDNANDTSPDKLEAQFISLDSSGAVDFIVKDDGLVGIGTNSPLNKLDVVEDGGASFASITGYRDSVGAGAAIRLQHARGTEASPMAILSGDVIGNFLNYGYDGSAFSRGANSRGRATENWTASAHGSKWEFDIIKNTTTANFTAMTIDQTGNVGIGVSSPLAMLHIDQSSTTAAIPGIIVDQADIDEDIFGFVCASDTNVDRTCVDAVDFPNPGAIVAWIKVNLTDIQATNPIPDGDYYQPLYAAPTP